MIGFIRLLVIVLGMIGGALYFFKNILNTNQWRKGISQGDLDILKNALSELKQNLVDLDKEELKLLSLHKDSSKIRKSGKKINAGVFYSIYNEPLVKYALIEYDQFRKLIHVATSEQDFIYRVGAKSTDVYCNDNYIGVLNIDGKLKSPLTKEVLISIENKKDTKYQRIEKDNKELAAVLNPLLVDNPNQRVVQYDELEDSTDRNMAISLLFLNMIERS